MNRKILWLIFALVVCVTLAACGPKATSDTTGSNAGTDLNASKETTGAGVLDDESAQDATGNQLENEETLPKDAQVSMGVAEGERAEGIDEIVVGTTPSTTTPTETTKPSQSNKTDDELDIMTMTYEQYISLSGEDQQKVIAMFGSADDFVRWYRVMEAKYKAEHPDVEIGGGGVNAGDIGG